MKPFAQPAFALVSSILLMSGCASHPTTAANAPTNHDLSAKALGGASSDSIAYKDALAHAFADLAQRSEPSRDIAAAGHKLDVTQTKNFTVFVYPKTRELSDQRVGVEKPVHFADETEYLVSVIGNGQCSTGTDLVPKAARPGCVTVEMRPAHTKALRPHENRATWFVFTWMPTITLTALVIMSSIPQRMRRNRLVKRSSSILRSHCPRRC